MWRPAIQQLAATTWGPWAWLATSLQEGGSSSTNPRVTRCPSNCSTSTIVLPEQPPSRATVRDNFSDDILDIGEFTLALRTMRMAFRFAMPWNFSVEAIEWFFCMTNYCQADLASSEKKAHILTQFTDYLLTQNCERWRDSEPFLTTGESKTAWGRQVEG